MTKTEIAAVIAGAMALVMFAMIFIVALIGLLPDAHAGQRCYQQNGSYQCYNDDGSSQRCWVNGNRVTCY